MTERLQQEQIIDSENPFLKFQGRIVMECPESFNEKYSRDNLNTLSMRFNMEAQRLFSKLVNEIFNEKQDRKL